MVGTKTRIHEEVSFAGATFQEDNGNRSIQNVVFLGAESEHGYTYIF